MSICLHGKRKSRCVECFGSQICCHKKRKEICRDCGGSSFCHHDKPKSRCNDCGGSQICCHGKRKERCAECGGKSICCHKKRKEVCKECKGSQICQHNKIIWTCKDCKGGSICEHENIKYFCVQCNGNSLCEHKKIKSNCQLCGGKNICIHGKIKHFCKECGGSSFCHHEKEKRYCKQCGGSRLCKSDWCETIGNSKYEGYCLPCFVNNPENKDKPNTRNYKTKEKEVVDSITTSFPNFTWISDKKVIDGCSRRRPDLLLDLGSHIIIVEVDENKHSDYDCICENKRLMELSKDLQHRPIVFIRFNPDDYVNNDGILVKSCWKLNKLGVMQIVKNKQIEWNERVNNLKQQIQYWIDNICEKTVEIIELYY